ncbi:hypothetical protein [Chelatococcus sp. YT9]|uniref:hypothetical protein n=1 Tax=Chelatococcus sp. YT9 TaxID=2835635 RepID=UPI001BCD5459|nr:hypothetical protein [Chelatococcus sp. YT9]MBS7701460.1 hypothetical protein [Chelatococcus sp. YT9]
MPEWIAGFANSLRERSLPHGLLLVVLGTLLYSAELYEWPYADALASLRGFSGLCVLVGAAIIIVCALGNGVVLIRRIASQRKTHAEHQLRLEMELHYVKTISGSLSNYERGLLLFLLKKDPPEFWIDVDKVPFSRLAQLNCFMPVVRPSDLAWGGPTFVTFTPSFRRHRDALAEFIAAQPHASVEGDKWLQALMRVPSAR